jgi:glycosyltransferase involved in cell wall biosynthesis
MKKFNKEDNFISTVLVVNNNSKILEDKLKLLNNVLESNFKNYEIIIVDNFSADNTLEILNKVDFKINVIELSKKHNSQQAIRAGIDLSIGDFIIEIEDIRQVEDFNILIDLYKTCLQGNDFVFYSPKRIPLSSKIFYKIINNYFKNKLHSDINSSILVISSRRGQNKTAETGSIIINRNISYLLSGLKYEVIYTDKQYKNKRGFFENVDLFIDTLIHYTDIITKTATYIALLFFGVSISFLLYGISIFVTIGAIEGWTSLTMFLSVSFSGLFLMFAIVFKYLFSILSVTKKTKSYSFKSITKK